MHGYISENVSAEPAGKAESGSDLCTKELMMS